MKITSKFSAASIKIYVNDILHIEVMRSKFVGLSSWQYETEGGLYYIEIVSDGGAVTVDYDKRDMWISILAELDKAR